MKQDKPVPKRLGKRSPSPSLPGLAPAGSAFVLNSKISATQSIPSTKIEKVMAQHPYAGIWVTDDNRVRHELLPNGRYDKACGQRENAYQGRHQVREPYIQYCDDTGFTADGYFVDLNTLPHGGIILRHRP